MSETAAKLAYLVVGEYNSGGDGYDWVSKCFLDSAKAEAYCKELNDRVGQLYTMHRAELETWDRTGEGEPPSFDEFKAQEHMKEVDPNCYCSFDLDELSYYVKSCILEE